MIIDCSGNSCTFEDNHYSQSEMLNLIEKTDAYSKVELICTDKSVDHDPRFKQAVKTLAEKNGMSYKLKMDPGISDAY